MCVGNGIGLALDDGVSRRAVRSRVRQLRRGVGRRRAVPASTATTCASRAGRDHRGLRVRRLRRERSRLAELQEAWEWRARGVFPYRAEGERVAAGVLQRRGYARSPTAEPRAAARGHPGLSGQQLRVRHRARLRAGRCCGGDASSSTTSRPTRWPRALTSWRGSSRTARSSCCPAASPAATSPTARRSSSRRSSARPR